MSENNADANQPWTMPVVVDDLPETGKHVSFSADAATREAVARHAGLRSLTELSAEFDIVRKPRGIAVTGQIKASVGQTCVVSLEPVESTVLETVELLFVPPVGGSESGTVKADPDDDEREPLVDGTIDLGAIAVEFLLLGIDPYPRKEGAKLELPAENPVESKPFAALAALKAGTKPNLK